MKGLDDTNWRRRESLPPGRTADTAITVLLAPFSTGLPPELSECRRSVAGELGLPESLIAAVAIALFLDEPSGVDTTVRFSPPSRQRTV